MKMLAQVRMSFNAVGRVGFSSCAAMSNWYAVKERSAS